VWRPILAAHAGGRRHERPSASNAHARGRRRRYAPLLAVLGLAILSPAAYAGSGYEKVTGTFGASCKSSPCPGGQFDEPTSAAVNDTTEDVYIVDSGDDRVEWFNSTGSKFEGQFNGSGEYEIAATKEKLKGAAPKTGTFLQPGGIAVNNDPLSAGHGEIYVADVGHEVIDEFAANGKYEGQITGGHCEDEEEQLPCSTGKLAPFVGPLNVTTDPAGDVWVYESGQERIYRFSDSGSLLGGCTIPERGAETSVPAFAVDSNGDIYATSPNRVDKFASGTCSREAILTESASETATLAIISSTNRLLVDEGSLIELFGSPFRTFPTESLSGSAGIAVDGAEGEGTLYATQRSMDNVEIFAAGAPEKPQLVSATASSTSSEAGQFEVVVNPENLNTTVKVEFSTQVSANGEELEKPITTLSGGELTAEFGEATDIVTGAELPKTSATYYYRVTVTNRLGAAVSKVYAYTKLPVVTAEAVFEKTSTTALLEATVEPDFIGETTYAFEYAETEASLENGEGTVVHGATGFLQRKKLEELKSREERLKKEEEEGAVAKGTVPICPGITEEGGTGTLPESETANLKCPVSAEVSGLVPGREYFYRVVTQNRVSEAVGNANHGKPVRGRIEELKPYGAPVATTGGAGVITATTATLSGEVNPEGALLTYEFAYIDKAGYLAAKEAGAANPYAEGEATELRALASSETLHPVGPIQAADLRPATVYHYALIATNQFGVQTIGQDQTFETTVATPPDAATGAAGPVTQTTVTLTGTITTSGLPTSYGFEVGTEPGIYGPPTGLGSVGGAATQEVSATLTGLQPGTTYYYRLTATNSDGTAKGEPAQSFTTAGLPYLLTVPAGALTAPIQPGQQNIEEHPKGSTGPPKLTNRQKLDKALKTCRRDRKKSKRKACERTARKRYPLPKRK
jgi:hypothetical protein